jgi:hypothetical protein
VSSRAPKRPVSWLSELVPGRLGPTVRRCGYGRARRRVRRVVGGHPAPPHIAARDEHPWHPGDGRYTTGCGTLQIGFWRNGAAVVDDLARLCTTAILAERPAMAACSWQSLRVVGWGGDGGDSAYRYGLWGEGLSVGEGAREGVLPQYPPTPFLPSTSPVPHPALSRYPSRSSSTPA